MGCAGEQASNRRPLPEAPAAGPVAHQGAGVGGAGGGLLFRLFYAKRTAQFAAQTARTEAFVARFARAERGLRRVSRRLRPARRISRRIRSLSRVSRATVSIRTTTTLLRPRRQAKTL